MVGWGGLVIHSREDQIVVTIFLQRFLKYLVEIKWKRENLEFDPPRDILCVNTDLFQPRRPLVEVQRV